MQAQDSEVRLNGNNAREEASSCDKMHFSASSNFMTNYEDIIIVP